MGVLKPYLITVFLLVVIVDVALARYYYRWFRFGRFQRTLKRCNKQSILDKLCPEVPEDDPCANIDCSCNGQCEDGVCTCDLGFTGDNCENDPCANIDCSCNGQCENGMCTCDPGFTGVNCDSEDVCALSEFCLNGATCENNECTCPDNFIGERCEFCTDLTTTEDVPGFLRSQFGLQLVPPPPNDDLSCLGRCDSSEDCSAFIFIDGECEFFQAPVLDMIDLSPRSNIPKCTELCQNTENCFTAVTESIYCMLLSVERDSINFLPFGGSTVDIIEENCDNSAP